MNRVSNEMAPDARREPRRIARAYSQGEQHRSRGHIVETRMGSGLAGGLLFRGSLACAPGHRPFPLPPPPPPNPPPGLKGFSFARLGRGGRGVLSCPPPP